MKGGKWRQEERPTQKKEKVKQRSETEEKDKDVKGMEGERESKINDEKISNTEESVENNYSQI